MRKFVVFSLVCSLMLMTACSKDEVVEQYNQALQIVGENNLTKDRDLQGKRKFGEDSYVGTYKADYDNFTGKETLFGGTSLEREYGNTITILCDLDIDSGTIKLLLQNGDETSQILCDTAGICSHTIELPSASAYIIIQADNFEGICNLTVE